jgi:hypothetical protein
LVLAAHVPHAGADESIKFSVDAGKYDRLNTPVRVQVAVNAALKDAPSVTVQDGAGKKLVGQLAAPSLLAKPAAAAAGMVARELNFVLPELKAGQSQNFTATVSTSLPASSHADVFHWKDAAGEYDDLLFGDRPVMRYMYHKLDESSQDSRMDTFKVYHHVFDPATGTQLLTKGPGGLWPHHHGVFYGFNKTTYNNGTAVDIWHCPAAFQEHSKFLAEEAGPVLGRQLIEINWMAEPDSPDVNNKGRVKGAPNAKFASEKREMTAYSLPGGTLIEFASDLTALMPTVHLDGDPQHAGFHFRATNDVHATHAAF